MDERRAHYRVTTSRGMRVALALGDDLWTGSVGDTTAAGASVVFATEEAPSLALGSRLRLTFSGGPLPAPVTVSATLKARSEGDFRRYGFAFDEPGRFGRGAASSVWGQFNRREWVRVSPDRPVTAHVETPDGGILEGRLADVSHGGIAVVLPAEAEQVLGDALRVRVTFRPAGGAADETHACAIRNRQLLKEPEVRYGMAFAVDAEEQALSVPVYEPAWDCAACGTSRLLAHTHAFCPMCGARPLHDRTYFPPWDEVVTAAGHVLTGTDRRCGACDRTWSSLARHCGGCAARL